MSSPYWIWPAGEVSSAVCDDWVARYDANVGTAVVDIDTFNPDVRRSKTYFVNDDDVVETMRNYCFHANRKAFGYNVGHFIDCQFTKYEATDLDFYDWHMDSSIVNRPNAFDRKLSCVVLLSDPLDYLGGDFEFMEHGKPEIGKGSVIVFPSVLYHRVSPVTEGVRHSMVAWLEGPPWQ